jgi:hypothetical protein
MQNNDDNIEEQKVMEAFLSFTSLFSKYVKENDKELFKRAVDYAKTYTEEDVSGVIFHYVDEDDDAKEN